MPITFRQLFSDYEKQGNTRAHASRSAGKVIRGTKISVDVGRFSSEEGTGDSLDNKNTFPVDGSEHVRSS